MMLDVETKRRIEELFAGQTCWRCGGAAQRLSRDRFYCHECLPARRDAEVRVHRLLGMDGRSYLSQN